MSEVITLAESSRLIALESKIGAGLQTFVEVGEALMEIRDSKLYRVEYQTFEEYTKGKWKMSKAFAFRQIAAAKAVVNLSPIGDIPKPKSESQVRPLSGLDPEQQREAWKGAVEKSGGEQPTAKQVEEAVKEVSAPLEVAPPENPKKEAPRAHGMMYADLAIFQLKKIQASDSQREEAHKEVIRWIQDNH